MENFSERVAFYPGSFNPFTVGHADIVKRALTVCDRLVVALGHNPAKKGYDASELADRIRAIYADEPRVCVMVYDGLSAHAAREAGASFMIRGVRSSADFEFERTLAETNLKVFGMENPWGNVWRRTAGLICNVGKVKAKITRGTKDGSTVSDYNTDGSGYKEVFSPSNGSGYISAMRTEKFGRLATAFSGSTTTYEADYAYYNNSGVRYALVGGAWNYDLNAGPFYINLGDAPGYAYPSLGAALSCKPLAAA